MYTGCQVTVKKNLDKEVRVSVPEDSQFSGRLRNLSKISQYDDGLYTIAEVFKFHHGKQPLAWKASHREVLAGGEGGDAAGGRWSCENRRGGAPQLCSRKH